MKFISKPYEAVVFIGTLCILMYATYGTTERMNTCGSEQAYNNGAIERQMATLPDGVQSYHRN